MPRQQARPHAVACGARRRTGGYRIRRCAGVLGPSGRRSRHVSHVMRGRGHHVAVKVIHDPDRSAERDDDEYQGEHQGQQAPAAFGFGIHVKEVDDMNNDLHGGQGQYHDGGCAGLCKHVVHDQPERNDRQNGSQDEACYVTAERAVAGAVVVIMMIVVATRISLRKMGQVIASGAHGSTPIR